MNRKRFPFALLSDGVRREVLDAAVPLAGKRGHVFFEEGAPCSSAFTVLRGRVHLEHRRLDGSTRILCAAGPGDVFCCLSILDGKACPATAVAAVRTDVLALPVSVYRSLMIRHSEFSDAVFGGVCRLLRLTGCRDPGPDAGAHVAACLVGLQEKFGPDLRFTRREIGDLAGVATETAIREIKAFEKRGWVEPHRGRVLITDQPALLRRSERRGNAPGRSPVLR